jgi:hypothetical protein
VTTYESRAEQEMSMRSRHHHLLKKSREPAIPTLTQDAEELLAHTNNRMKPSAVLKSVLDFYLQSNDFNGYPVYRLKEDYKLSDTEAKDLMESLIAMGQIDVMFTGNPHIKPFESPSIDEQLSKLRQLNFSDHFCLYPVAKALSSAPAIRKYTDRPYKQELALGAGQLEFRVFDLSVLEHYRNDPRYHYGTDSIHGNISVRDEFFKSGLMPDRDQVLLQSFGFAYDEEMNRAAAVFLRYLSGLSPEHQQIWRAKELNGNYILHPDYYRSSILGEWGTRISIFEAFIEELILINKMTILMEMAPLFRRTFAEPQPKDFAFLLRPTLAEFNRFVLLLDQMMSDNLNTQFFGSSRIPLEAEKVRSDGKIVVTPYGTITLLEMWIKKYFHPVDPQPINGLLATFRKVRRLRQNPAHAANEDTFDQQHFKVQRHLMIEAYTAVRTIRLCLANHPKVRTNPPKIGKQLADGEIWDR